MPCSAFRASPAAFASSTAPCTRSHHGQAEKPARRKRRRRNRPKVAVGIQTQVQQSARKANSRQPAGRRQNASERDTALLCALLLALLLALGLELMLALALVLAKGQVPCPWLFCWRGGRKDADATNFADLA